MHTDIKDKSDIKKVIDAFYTRVREDELLSPIFQKRIPADDWQPHLDVMYNFWNTVIFAQEGYRGNPFSKHLNLGIEKLHFDRWINLFHQTVDDMYAGPNAIEMKERAVKMRMLFESKLFDNQTGGMKSII